MTSVSVLVLENFFHVFLSTLSGWRSYKLNLSGFVFRSCRPFCFLNGRLANITGDATNRLNNVTCRTGDPNRFCSSVEQMLVKFSYLNTLSSNPTPGEYARVQLIRLAY